MVAKCVTILTMAVAAALTLASGRTRTTAAFEVDQPDTQGEGTRDPLPTQIVQQAMDLIQQRAVALHLKLPPLALRGDLRSRHLDADLSRQPGLTLENHEWRAHLVTAEDGALELDLPTAFRLATIHSDAYQRQVESLFLAAFHALATNRGTTEGRSALQGATPAHNSLDADISRFYSFRQQLLATVAAGNTRDLLSSRTAYPPAQFGTAPLAGYLGLVEQRRWIQLTKDLLAAHSSKLTQLDAYHHAGLITLSNVDMYRQLVEQQRAELDSAESMFQDAINSFKIKILGLPPSLPVRLRPSLISGFELTDPLAKQLAERITRVEKELGTVHSQNDEENFQRVLRELPELLNHAESLVSGMEKESQQFDEVPAAHAQYDGRRQREAAPGETQPARRVDRTSR